MHIYRSVCPSVCLHINIIGAKGEYIDLIALSKTSSEQSFKSICDSDFPSA